jgi:hypothetical protein
VQLDVFALWSQGGKSTQDTAAFLALALLVAFGFPTSSFSYEPRSHAKWLTLLPRDRQP